MLTKENKKKNQIMLISLLIFLLVSNAVTLRQDKSILFSRVVIKSLLFASFLAFNNLFTQPLEKGNFYINFYPAISLAITLFSFVGVPPLIGFFAKQMVLSAIDVRFNPNSITINSALSSTIYILTLLFMYIPGEWFNIVSIITLIFFKA